MRIYMPDLSELTLLWLTNPLRLCRRGARLFLNDGHGLQRTPPPRMREATFRATFMAHLFCEWLFFWNASPSPWRAANIAVTDGDSGGPLDVGAAPGRRAAPPPPRV